MTPASVLSSSKSFHRGFELCYGNGLPANNGFKNAIIPGVVCLTFSIELGFKAILIGCNLSAHGHEFSKLFKKLPDEVKSEIIDLVTYENEDFQAKLDLVSNAFTKWRYLFEENGYHSIDIDFLSKLYAAVVQIAQRYAEAQRAKLVADLLDTQP